MTKESHIVCPADVRPARPDGTCFYCRTPLGQEHAKGCVIRCRTVVVDFTFRAVMSLPEDYTASDVNFKYNDSSWCAGNIVQDLAARNNDGDCMCDRSRAEFVREATADDEERYGVMP